MFKNMLKRSWLSIKRKLGRTVILTLIFFMMANLVLAALIIKSAVSAQTEYAKSTLGGTVTVQADMDKIRDNQKTEMEQGSNPGEMFKQMSRPSTTITTANEIATTYPDYVKDYSYELSASANANGLQTVETKGFGGRSSKTNSGSSDFPGGGPGQMPGMPDMNTDEDEEEASLDADLTISGINAYAYLSGVQSGTLTIKEGEYFDENSADGVLISYEFAQLNSLSVGSELKLKNIYTEKSVTLKILGIYDSSEERADANTLYMNTETAAKFLSNTTYNSGDYTVQNVNFYMNSSETAEEFAEKVNSQFSELAENNLKLAIDTSEYDSISSQIESVASFANTILIIVIVATVIIITLIVTINVKDRRYEIGVLMSLGASKKNIIGQIITELIIVGTLGFVLASATGTVFAGTLGDKILASQSASSAKQSEQNFGRPGPGVGMPGDFSKMSRPGEKQKEIKLDLNPQPANYLLLFVTGYLTIILALILPALSITKYQPKEILSGKE